MNKRRSAHSGFTLLEVLVALAIFALVATTVLTASQRSLKVADLLERKTLAGWIAGNTITEWQLQKQGARLDHEDRVQSYAGRQWDVHVEVEGDGSTGLRRITTWVAIKPERSEAIPIKKRADALLSGYLVPTP